ncbi:MAG: AAA family ATPase [Smithella sp.]
MILIDKVRSEILAQVPVLEERGEIIPDEKLADYYRHFRSKFGPEVLEKLDGETLLDTMHNSSNKDSLVYWLEFKNDEEMPNRFGSIAGGSALKFGIYRRGDTGYWMSGSPQRQIVLKLEEAIQIARRNRDQFKAGVSLLDSFPENASDEQYITLEARLGEIAPDVFDTAWGHKYFSLMFPNKLDNYHVADYQRFHLMKMLQMPVKKEGRYSVAGQYMAIARELNLHINNLDRILNELHGSLYKYWLVRVNYATGADIEGKHWKEMREGGYVGIGWRYIGDLSGLSYDTESKNKLKALMLDKYNERGGFAQEIFNFVTVVQKGDLILATEKEGAVLGIGRVVGDYYYEEGNYAPNRKKVEWFPQEQWHTPVIEIKNRVVKQLLSPENILAVESRLLGLTPHPKPEPSPLPLSGVTARIKEVLERKKQIILYGPPGTGKTYWAYQSITDLASQEIFDKSINEHEKREKSVIIGSDQNLGFVRVCTFHPSYGYEDFIEGYRPISTNGVLSFDLRQGIFKQLCHDAADNASKKFYLLIDEINRGDIPRIFGELLTILEKDKRGKSIILPVSGERFSVPENVYLVGTMNTADRSIALLDTALRRRFGFMELMPDPSLLGDAVLNGIPLRAWLESLNERILHSIGRDARNLQIGHAYFLENGKPLADFSRFVRVIMEDIIPLLEEYCYEDYEALEKILGKNMVDREKQRVRYELFDENRKEDLVLAFLEPSPELTTASIVVQREETGLISEEETQG